MLALYSDSSYKRLRFKYCEDGVWTAKYIFQESIDPKIEFDDSVFIDIIENVSPISIKGNRGYIIFVNNTFSENIGMFGGVIHIESPDFTYGDLPFIVMKGNTFK